MSVSKLYGGWAEYILRINLTNKKIVKQPLTKELAFNFLGGRGINSKILFDEVPVGTDPFSPENRLIFGVGPLNGTLSPAAGRYTVSAKSPLTGILGDANCGGHWAAELKYAGYGNIVFQGKAEDPVYLWIDDEHVELRNAKHLWGLTTWEVEKEIINEIGNPNIKVVSIGPAGENLVRFACVITELGRAAGRTGMGAVMGSKKLKAIAVHGSKGVKIARPKDLEKATLESYDTLMTDLFYRLYADYGTPGLLTLYNEYGANTAYNSREAWVEWFEEVSGETFIAKYSVKHKACFSCPFHCDKFYRVESGPYACYGDSCEFETITAFGTRCGNKNLASICKGSTLADNLGMDTISAGAVIGWAMECYEKGIITKEDTDGLELTWGNPDAILETIKKIAYREGFGNILAEGVRRASEKIGKGSEEFAVHIKGMETPAVDPRAVSGYGALGYAVASRGGDHLRALAASSYMMAPELAEKLFGSKSAADRFAAEGQGRCVKFHEDMRAVADSLEMCKYITRTALLFPEPLAKILAAVTGWDLRPEELVMIGERINNIERAFNVREGITRKDDTQPKRLLKEPIPRGPSKGHYCAEWLDQMLDEYYENREWDIKTGLPTKKKLEKLGLKYVANELEKMGKLPKSSIEKRK
ncbi:MAG: aldehyde ferredoxin oxidoreductase family protein [Candidatus Bathyarchaeia archaeon]